MIFRDIIDCYGKKFVFIEDVDRGDYYPYMVVKPDQTASDITIVSLTFGNLAGFSDEDRIMEDKVLEIP